MAGHRNVPRRDNHLRAWSRWVAPHAGAQYRKEKIEFSAIGVRDPAEIERGVATFSRSANGGLIVTASVLATAHPFEWTVYRFGIAGISEFEQPYRDAVRPSRAPAESGAASGALAHERQKLNNATVRVARRRPEKTSIRSVGTLSDSRDG